MTLTRTSLLLVILAALALAGVAMAQDDAPTNPAALQGEMTYTVQVSDTLDTIGTS